MHCRVLGERTAITWSPGLLLAPAAPAEIVKPIANKRVSTNTRTATIPIGVRIAPAVGGCSVMATKVLY